MMTKRWFLPLLSFLMLIGTHHTVLADETVFESARQIPIARKVDVVVVGGGTGAVSAAIAAARDGASVFLAAPFPYLGDDMTATLRLWLEEGEQPEHPLAQKIFTDPNQAIVRDPDGLPFTYQADTTSAARHAETKPPSRLTDQKWNSAVNESIEYGSDTTVTADLGKSQALSKVRLIYYRREQSGGDNGDGFDVGRLVVSVSDDQQTWQEVSTVEPKPDSPDIGVVEIPLDAKARFVRLLVQLPAGYQRMLLGELEVIGVKDAEQAAVVQQPPPPRPMHIKKSLDDVLIEEGVQFLYSCMVTDVLRDTSGNLCGVVMANRAGRQAVIAKTVIDATPRAIVARLAGAEFQSFEGGTHLYRRVVIGGEPKKIDGIDVRIAAPEFGGVSPTPAVAEGGKFPVIEYTLPLHIDDDSYDALMKVDQQARTLTYDPEQQFTSDLLFEIPTDPMVGRRSVEGDWPGVDALPIDAFRPANTDRLYVLSASADLARPLAEKLMRPLALIDMGQRLGVEAAAQTKEVAGTDGAHLPGTATSDNPTGDVYEFLTGVRPTDDADTIPQESREIPVLGHYDVVVIGGGTGGAPAGIGAARQGAKTLVIEYLYGLGGVGTQGAIANYYWGNRVGFTSTVLDGTANWRIEPKMEWYRQELVDAGADVWFGSIGCGVYKQGNRVVGAVVATPFGRGVVMARTVIDATGNSDVAAAAGAECIYTDESEFGMQGTGLPGRRLGGRYNNTDFTIVDETDMVDVWRMLVFSKAKYSGAFDHGRLIDTRERRRIVGDFTISMTDELNERTYPDTVVRAYSNFDTHGYTIDPYFLVEHPEKKGIYVNIPLRAMLPKGLEGIVVTGLGISSHRDAVPLIRMQPDIQNGGYAAGVAAAMAAQDNVPIRQVDVKRLQEHLVEVGNLPESVLTDEDSYPLSDEAIAAAVAALPSGHGAAVVGEWPDRSLPIVRKAFEAADTPEDRLVYAKVLALLGSNLGLDVLIDKVAATEQWDAGWNYRGMGQYGSALSPLDNVIVLIGLTREKTGLPVILEKVELLDASKEFSHHRAVGRALELIGDPQAAEPLARLLQKPDMQGHVHTDIDVAKDRGVGGGTNSEQTRRESLRELLLARALYRCGDYDGLGEMILRRYTKDLRGHLARHAKSVLEESSRP
jgi:hypothetical protein